jgi:hypothetical protein
MRSIGVISARSRYAELLRRVSDAAFKEAEHAE